MKPSVSRVSLTWFGNMTLIEQITVARPAQAEFTEKKSRFICRLFPVADEEQAKRLLEQVRAENKGARHNVYAWIIGEQDEFMRSSDDGEPSGTGGRPVLESLKQAGLHNVMAVVTRYFGGILLGASGLTRAYAKAVQLAIDAAQRVVRFPAAKYAATIDYTYLAKAESLLAAEEVLIEDRVFGEKICLICAVKDENVSAIRDKLLKISNGSIRLDDLGEKTWLEKPL